MIVYLHGFMSGPGSHKAMQFRDYMRQRAREDEYACPKLTPYPGQAIRQLEDWLTTLAVSPCLIGSSLGGYYALWLAEKFACKAVLVNPAIRPYDDLAHYLGPQVSPYTSEAFTLEPHHIDELKAIDIPHITRPERYWLLSQTGDEVLDYRQGVEKLAGARQTVIEGGDHSFQGFEAFIPAIDAFAHA